MARLIDGTVAEVTADTLTCAKKLAKKHNAIVALKTAATVIAHPDGRYAINTRGTPGMSTAGMGDVLTGLIAGLLSQGVPCWEATCTAVYLHSVAGVRAEAIHGQRGMNARSVLDKLPEVLRDFELA